jgi:hypothetical protein
VLLVLVVVDVAALFAFFAMLVDGELLGDRRRRFSLRSLLLAMTFAAVNAGCSTACFAQLNKVQCRAGLSLPPVNGLLPPPAARAFDDVLHQRRRIVRVRLIGSIVIDDVVNDGVGPARPTFGIFAEARECRDCACGHIAPLRQERPRSLRAGPSIAKWPLRRWRFRE